MAVITRNVTSVYARYRNESRKRKNRFNVFGSNLLASDSAAGDQDESTGRERLLGSSNDGAQIEMAANLPPLWVDELDRAQEELHRLNEKINQLQKKQQKSLLRVFDETEGSSEMNELTSQITDLMRRCEARVRQITIGSTASSSEAQLRANAQKALATELQTLSQNLRKQQKSYLESAKKGYAGTMEYDKQKGFRDEGFSDELLEDVQIMEQSVELRNEELKKIMQSITELHSIFKEVSIMVIDQGTMLDRIDYNLEQVVHQTMQANVQLRKAEKHQKSSRVMRCIMLLMACIFFLAILLILKHVL